MCIVITGAGGFIGKKLARQIQTNEMSKIFGNVQIEKIILVDVVDFTVDDHDCPIPVKKVVGDISEAAFLESHLANEKISILFHLAAIVSFQAEKEFELGMRVNFFGTYRLLELCRQTQKSPMFIMASSVAVFGGNLPEILPDEQRLTPQTSYGAQKAMCELLIDDYSRKGFIDGRALRLPTIVVRPGKPNLAASTFTSSIIREPLQGQETECPVDPDAIMWLLSPRKLIHNLCHTLNVSKEQLGFSRVLNLPGFSVSVKEMIECLEYMAGKRVVEKITFKINPAIEKIVRTWPKKIDTQKAFKLGYQADNSFEEIIENFINDDCISQQTGDQNM